MSVFWASWCLAKPFETTFEVVDSGFMRLSTLFIVVYCMLAIVHVGLHGCIINAKVLVDKLVLLLLVACGLACQFRRLVVAFWFL